MALIFLSFTGRIFYMSRLQSKYKRDRRLMVNLWGREKSPVVKRNYLPGQHGPKSGSKRPPRLTDYCKQLHAKQKLRFYYGDIREKQFRRIFKEATRRKGNTGEIMIGLLERRLASVVYRMKLAPTVFAARQIVNHGHIRVNGQKVNIPSYMISEGDVVELSDQMKDNANILLAIESKERDVPDYIEMNIEKKSAKFTRVPKLEEVPYPVKMEPNVVVEFYSR